MPVEFILGAAGSGKTTYCYEAIKNELRKDEFTSLIMLVPEQFNLQAQYDLSKRLYPGLLRAQILSFNSLAREIINEVGLSFEPIIDDLERIMILRKIVEEHKDEMVFFKKNIYATGFIDNINRMITVFEQSDIEPDLLIEIANDTKATSLFKNKMTDMSRIYGYFNSYIKGKFVTAEKTMIRLAKAIEDSKLIEKSMIWIDGFYGFTGTQIKVLRALFQKAKKASLTLPADRIYLNHETISETHAFYESIRNYQYLASLCTNEEIECKSIFLRNNDLSGLSEEMSFLQENYLKGRSACFKGDVKNVEISKFCNIHEETECLAKKITTLVRDHNYRYRDIAVIVGDLNEYKLEIETIFTEYNLPFFLDMKKNVQTNGLIVVILKVLEVIASNYSYSSMMSLLRSYMFDIEVSEIDRLENYILKYGIKGKKKWQEEWEFDKEDKEEEIKINHTREKILKPIMELEMSIHSHMEKGKASVLELSKAVFQFLESINAYEAIQKRINRNRLNHERVLELENEQIWGQVLQVLERLVMLLGDEKMNIGMYKKILSTSFSYLEMGIIPHSQDQVIVGTIDRSRIPRVKAMFILGANEGVIPKVSDTMQIFSDMDKVTLTQICKGQDYKKDRLNDIVVNQCMYASNFNIYTAITRATDKLYISYPLADENGKLLRASSFVSTIKRLFSLTITSPKRDLLEYVHSPMPTFGHIGYLLREEILGRGQDEEWKDIVSWYYQNEKWKDKLLGTTKYLFYTNQQEYLEDDSKKMLYGLELKTSISQLEKFRQCPCSYFIEYGIKAKERDKASWNKAKIGVIFHSCLERYPKELERLGTTWTKANSEQVNEAIKQSILYSLDKYKAISKEDVRYEYTVSKLERMMARGIFALTEHLKYSEFTPKDYEIGFGEADFPPIKVVVDDERYLLIRGQIDRVDVYYKEGDAEYIKILDYKSGNKEFDLMEVYYGLQLQLLLYLDAYLKQSQSYKPAGVFYFHIRDNYIDYKVGMTKEEVEANRLKQYKLSGLALNETDIIKALASQNVSSILPISIKKDGELSKNSSVATREQFHTLEEHIIDTIKGLGKGILDGRISARPIKLRDKNPCAFCKYHTICQFDEKEHGNTHDILEPLNRDEIWERICNLKEER